LKTHDTTKLFYDQYVYKLTFINGLASIFRNKNLTYARMILDRLDSSEQDGEPLAVRRVRRIEPVTIAQFNDAKKLIQFFYKFDDYTLRIELSKISIYSNSKVWLTSIKDAVDPESLQGFWEPNPTHASILKPNVLITNSYPNFNYKVTLGRGIGSPEFAKFALNNPTLIKAGPEMLSRCHHKNYMDGFYFFVRDEKTLALINLFISNIRRIDKIVAM